MATLLHDEVLPATRAVHPRGAEAELAELRAQLARAQDQLRHADKVAKLGQIAAGIIHEISSPLGCVFSNFSIVQGHVDDLLRLRQHDERVQWDVHGADHLARLIAMRNESALSVLRHDLPTLMEETRAGIARVLTMMRNLQDFARTDNGQAWQWADLHQGIESTLAVAAAIIRPRADVVREFGQLPPVRCLPDQLNQVVMNLVVNAAHAIDSRRGTITLRTGVEGEQVWLSVGDNGGGIAPEHLARIFDPFFTTKPAGAGTGLGLSLVRTIVQKHHGRIQVESRLGEGTTFRIELPIAAGGNDGVAVAAQ
jgi:two-component system NtrC family sensor kinase